MKSVAMRLGWMGCGFAAALVMFGCGGEADKGAASGSAKGASAKPAASGKSSAAAAAGSSAAVTASASAAVEPAGECAACKDGYKDPKGRLCIKLPDGYKLAEDATGAGGTQETLSFAKDGDKKNPTLDVTWYKTQDLAVIVGKEMNPKGFTVDEDTKLPGGGRVVHSTKKDGDEVEERLSLNTAGKGQGVLYCEAGYPTEVAKEQIAACRTLCAAP